ncbi:protein SMAX1-like [Dendrobium catenatum]|uniref:Chaperone protein ClpB1 n=1 Tax=Dendrobium catenatum TaxID=906689 RepID=A0A2I0XEG2_9ASPA|nr:protein SMAX1-like [Dendrobium catenatum]PKU86280.1 Chaperone protein ClpB1 [Dendrobium catenatum]
MRAGLSTIQQTLTPEASAVLNRAIAEAARRRHGQTTPLHVAAALLSSPSGHLRQACIRSHPNPSSSHPLQCRALELCFSVALDRLPSASTVATPSPDDSPTPPPPPISNALMAALKRAQAHQRRGCPESQQQPLLAVKVELEHLLLSILDDPSVSRVMREASFSSPAVKASIENSLSSSPSPSPSPSPARNLYLSPRLVGAAAPPAVIAPSVPNGGGGGDVAKVFDILTRTKKRNPILVGDADPGAVMREVIGKIGTGDGPVGFRSVAVISTEKELVFSSSDRTEIPSKIRELNPMIDSRLAAGGASTGIILDLGDLKWLVEGASQQQSMTDVGRSAVAEISGLLVRFGGRLSLVGTATCATYLRCQVYFPMMESDWDLQAVPIAPRSAPFSGLAPRVGSNVILSSKIESFGTPRGFPALGVSGMTLRKPSESLDAFCKNSLCNLCKESYEREVAKLGEDESEKSAEGTQNARKSLPRWLQIATTPSPNLQNKEQELMKKWRDNCFRLHRNSLPVASKPPITGFPSTKPIPINPTQLKLTLQTTTVHTMPERPPSPAATAIKTDLALGPVQKPAATKFTGDATSIKRLVNGLLDKVSWQAEAASAVAAAVIQSNSGIGKRRNGSQKADTWLLFAGPDRVGKHKMAVALSELVFGATPLIIRLGLPEAAAGDEPEEYNVSFRGRTSIDRVAEALRVNPFSTIFFEDFDQTDSALRGTIRRAMERGRLVDSRGREVGLGNAIFILTAGWLPEELGNSNEELRRSEEKITKLATSGRQLQFQLEEKTNKRRSQWLFNDERLIKPRKDSLSLDLNLAASAGAGNEEACEGSLNSSDLTVEHGLEHGHGRLVMQSLATPILTSSWTSDLIELIDSTIVFKPMDFTPLRTKVSDSVSAKFTQIMGEGWSIAIDDDALDQMTGGVWLGGDASNLFDEWTDRVLAPAVEQLKGHPKVDEGVIVRLSSVKSGVQLHKSYLPASVKLAVGDR